MLRICFRGFVFVFVFFFNFDFFVFCEKIEKLLVLLGVCVNV